MADRWSAFLFEIMKYLVKAKEMKQFDRNTIEHFGILSEVLIERAALAAFEELQKKLQPAQTRILIVCGNGNNGADGLALARLLHLAGAEVTTLLLGDRTKATPENKKELQINEAYGILSVTDPDQLQTENWDVVVDALFGVGLSRKIEGEFARCWYRHAPVCSRWMARNQLLSILDRICHRLSKGAGSTAPALPAC